MRSIVTSLSIVAALAAGGAMLSTAGAQDKGARTYSAERGKTVAKKKPVRTAKVRKSRTAAKTRSGRQAKAARPPRVAGFARTQPGATKQPGSCGTYMYWKDGSCADARNKK